MRAPWLLLQLTDSGFPSGGFAHSSGLEALVVLAPHGSAGFPPAELEAFVHANLAQTGRLALPFVEAAAREPTIDRLVELDRLYDAMLPLAGPNRASRAQGRALANAATRIWPSIAAVAEHASSAPAHHPPIFGAVFGLLGVSPREAAAAFLHTSARGLLSAGVRLGLVGPLEAQRILATQAPHLDRVLADAKTASTADAAQTTPLFEIFGALHERLDGRMFQS